MIIDFSDKLETLSLTELFEHILIETDYLSIYEGDENEQERKETVKCSSSCDRGCS